MSEHEQVAGMLSAKNAAPLELDPTRTALIIVDMQRYFTQPSFPFTDLFEKMSPGVCSGYLRRVRESVIPSIRRLLDHFRSNGSLVVFTAVGTEKKDGSDLAGWARALDDAGMAFEEGERGFVGRRLQSGTLQKEQQRVPHPRVVVDDVHD